MIIKAFLEDTSTKSLFKKIKCHIYFCSIHGFEKTKENMKKNIKLSDKISFDSTKHNVEIYSLNENIVILYGLGCKDQCDEETIFTAINSVLDNANKLNCLNIVFHPSNDFNIEYQINCLYNYETNSDILLLIPSKTETQKKKIEKIISKKLLKR